MNNKKLIKSYAGPIALLILFAGQARAAEPIVNGQELIDAGAERLSPVEVKALIGIGPRIESVAPASGNLRTWISGEDGKLVATLQNTKGSATGQGAWQVNDEGFYCVEISWKQIEEKWCRAVYRIRGANYLGPKNLASNPATRLGRLTVTKASQSDQTHPGAQASIRSTAPGVEAATAASTVLQPGVVRKVQMIYMGGNDCPPCVAWRATELPKLRQMQTFEKVQFNYVVKTVKSPVPSATFLPEEVRPFKEQLDLAGAGNKGSAQTAIMVDGKVFDYYWGYRTAEEIESRLKAILEGGVYPFDRCIKMKRADHKICEQKV